MYAFIRCDQLTSVTLPNSASIGTQAFSSCTSLKSVTVPGGITSMGVGIFSHCSSLTSVTIPDSVTKIASERLVLPMMGIDEDMGAFAGCKCAVTYKGKTYSPNEYEALYKAINGK